MTCYNPLHAWLRNDFEDEWTVKHYPIKTEYVRADGKRCCINHMVLFNPNKFLEYYYETTHSCLCDMVYSPHEASLYAKDFCYSDLGTEIFRKYYDPVEIPCGSCVGCRIAHCKEMSARAWFEAQQWKYISDDYTRGVFGERVYKEKLCCAFITLTLSPEYMEYRTEKLGYPYFRLDHREFQLFMKRLRKYHSPIRYFMCGEYGSKTGRPHYHAIIYGFDFPDKQLAVKTRVGAYYNSKILDDLWSVRDPFNHKLIMRMGLTSVSEVTAETCSYVARYVLKKLEDGSFDGSYTKMSTNPGIGFCWLEHNMNNMINLDYVNTGKYLIKPPRYYDNKVKELYPEYYEQVIQPRRREHAMRVSQDLSLERLADLKSIHGGKIDILKRKDNF